MRRRAPQFDIRPVLEALGAENVPHVHGDRYAKIICPFHPDTTPSASVSRYGFRCWACGETGDAISLIRKHEGLTDFESAVSRCAELCGSADPGGREEPGRSPSLLDL